MIHTNGYIKVSIIFDKNSVTNKRAFNIQPISFKLLIAGIISRTSFDLFLNSALCGFKPYSDSWFFLENFKKNINSFNLRIIFSVLIFLETSLRSMCSYRTNRKFMLLSSLLLNFSNFALF